MDYSIRHRPPHKRRVQRHYKNSSSGGAGKVLLIFILIACIVYLATATAAGTWVAENIVAPIFEAFQGTTNTGSNIDIIKQTTTPGSTASSSSASKGTEVTVEGLKAYALQLGVFSNETNASAAAKEVVARGGGGYIIQDGTKYRVIAAVYSNEADISTVRKQLSQQGYDSTNYTMEGKQVSFKVTANEKKISAIQSGFDGIVNSLKDLAAKVYDFTKNSQSIDQGKESINNIVSNLNKSQILLTDQVSASDNSVISALISYYEKFKSDLNSLSSGEFSSATAFSAKLNYTHVEMTCEYIKLLTKITGT